MISAGKRTHPSLALEDRTTAISEGAPQRLQWMMLLGLPGPPHSEPEGGGRNPRSRPETEPEDRTEWAQVLADMGRGQQPRGRQPNQRLLQTAPACAATVVATWAANCRKVCRNEARLCRKWCPAHVANDTRPGRKSCPRGPSDVAHHVARGPGDVANQLAKGHR